MFDLRTLLGALPVIGPVVAAAPEFVKLFDQIVDTLNPDDQATAKEALADLMAENDEGHARLQAKLKAAALKR